MVSVRRVFCVAVPLVLLAASIICLLISGLTGVSSNDLYLFRVNLTELEVDPVSASSLISKLGGSNDTASLVDSASTTKITASDLGLANIYDISLWGYCYLPETGDRICSKAMFDWASYYLNATSLEANGSASATEVELPAELTSSLKVFKKLTKWAEVVFIIAMGALGIEIFFGFFTACSTAISCCTWIFATFASVAVCCYAVMVTAISAIVVGAIEASAKWYGVKASMNTSFLAVTWVGAALSLAATLFWLFTICCCKPKNRPHDCNRKSTEKIMGPASYTPINPDQAAKKHSIFSRRQGGANQGGKAYEPYRNAV